MASTKRTVSLAALGLLAQMLGPHRGVGASSPPDSIHFCASDEYVQWRRDHPGPAAKRPANLNLGEPRTVRMIYFLPNDWPYRAEVVDSMKTVIRQAQNFYAEQMQAHGYGNWTFRIETDAQGEPMVHRVDGKHPFSHYDNTLGTAVVAELEETFDLDANIYFIVLGTDALRQGNGQPAEASGGGGRRTAVTWWCRIDSIQIRWPMNWDIPSVFSTNSGTIVISCHMVPSGVGFCRRVLPRFFQCIPTSTPPSRLKKAGRLPWRLPRLTDICPAQQASRSGSRSAIQTGFIRSSCLLEASQTVKWWRVVASEVERMRSSNSSITEGFHLMPRPAFPTLQRIVLLSRPLTRLETRAWNHSSLQNLRHIVSPL